MNDRPQTFNQALSIASPFLKGVAIIGIILHHYYRGLYGITQNVQWIYSGSFLATFSENFFSGIAGAFVSAFYYLGYMGVSIFFVLSGWGLAVSALKRKGDFSLTSYFKNRIVKIFPLYLASLVFFGLLFYGQGNKGLLDQLLGLFAKLLLLTNYSPSAIFTINPSFWFLGTIGILYILFPVIFIAANKRPSTTLISTLAIAYLSTLAIQSTPLQQWHPFFAMGGFPLAKIGEFSLGIFIAIIAERRDIFSDRIFKNAKNITIALALLLLGFFSFSNNLIYPLHPILLVVPTIFFLTKFYLSVFYLPILAKPIAYAGIYSYSAFLLHRPFVDAWINAYDQNGHPILFGLIFLSVSVILCSLFEIICNKYTTPLITAGISRVFGNFSSKKPARI